jgi:hypothetical protein
MFAFNAQTQAYLGSYVFDGSDANHPYYNNIRQWHVINNNLFTGVGKPNGKVNGGAMLRWTGTLAAPFSFLEVGEFPGGQPAYFIGHTDGHMYATTWGSGGAQFGMSLYMSPPLNASTGLDVTDANNWTEVWNLDQYEVEPSVVELGGAIESFGGYLYFGTMQVPLTSALRFTQMYPNATVSSASIILNTNRPIEIFRTQGFDPTLQPTPSVELLYGSATLEQYNPSTDAWAAVANGMGATPTYGAAGFGVMFNNYTWAMEVFQGQLYVGTMDWAYIAANNQMTTSLPSSIVTLANALSGAELWSFANTSSAATAVNVNGMGNTYSYGIRTMVTDNRDLNLWIGMANPINLRTDMSNSPGGWKLIDFPMQNGAPVITWYNPADIVYGTPLTATQLNASASSGGSLLAGTFTYTPPMGTVLSAGASQMLSLNFAPFNSGNQYSDTVKINVTTEPLAATASNVSMVYGTTPPLPFTGTLTGVVNNDGITATYSTAVTPTSTTAAGTYTITPVLSDPNTKLANYAVTLTNGTLTISKAGATSSVSATAASVLVNASVTLTAHVASATTGTPTGSVTFLDGKTSLGVVALDASGNAQLPINTLAAGSHTITVSYPGDGNFVASTSPAMTEVIQDFQFNAGSASVLSATILPGGVANFSFSIAPTNGNYFPNAITLTLTGVPSPYTYTITPATIPAGSGPVTVVVQVQTYKTSSLTRSLPSGLAYALILLPVMGLFSLRRRARGAGILLLALLGVALVLGTNGCNGKSGVFAAPSQTSTLTVTGTCGTLQHTVTLNLTVQ